MNSDIRNYFTRRSPILGESILGVWLASYLLVAAAPAMALPQGGEIVAGEGSINQTSATTMQINQNSQRMAADFAGFDIAADEAVNIAQPNAQAFFLGRVTGESGTTIMGTLSANGSVLLVNPRGVYFGETARVDTASLMASTLGVSTEDFMNGVVELEFTAEMAGKIINQGVLEAASGGSVTLLGNEVINEGLIVAEMGQVNLGAGSKAVATFDPDGLIGVQVTEGALASAESGDAAVLNAGTISAEGGQIFMAASAARDLFSMAVNNTGIARASSASVDGGTITLFAGEGDTFNSGTLDASSTAGNGGSISVLGDNVAVTAGTVDASGATGGGDIKVGGALQGGGDTKTAATTELAAGASLVADATVDGDGGEVILWADDTTEFYGSISADSVGSGSGGFVEVSAKNDLYFGGDVSVDGGTLLIDPTDINIVDAAAAATVPSSPVTANTLNDADIETFLNSSGSLQITTASALAEAGDITMDAAASITWGSGVSLELIAENTITLSGTIDGGATGTLFLNAAGAISQGAGSITIGTLDLDSASGATSVAQAGNDFGAVVFNTSGDVTLSDSNGYTINSGSTSTGNVAATATTGAITVQGYGSATTTLDAPTINLNGSISGTVTQGGSITLVNLNTAVAGDVTTAATLAAGQTLDASGSGTNSFNYADINGVATFIGDDTNDTLVFPAGGHTINIVATGTGVDGVNDGNDNGTFNFLDVPNLTGGADAEAVIFEDGADLAGIGDFGGGANTLDFSAFTAGNVVDIDLDSVLTSGTLAITGGAATTDNITAKAAGTTFTITGVTNSASGGYTFTGFESVTGAAGADALTANTGADAIFAMTGADSGALTDTTPTDIIAFSGIETLNGEAANTTTLLTAAGGQEVTLTGPTTATITGGSSLTALDAVQGGIGTDKVLVGDGVVFTGTIDGGAGAGVDEMSFELSSSALNFDITAGDAGDVDAADDNAFTGFESLTGTAVAVAADPLFDDVFAFADGITWNGTGVLDGNGGRDNFSYAAWSTPLNINLPSGGGIITGTTGDDIFGVNAAFTGEVNGGAGNDTLNINDASAVGAFTFNGGTGGETTGDSINIVGTTGAITTLGFGFVNNTDGTIDFDGTTVTYTGLEPIVSAITPTNVSLVFSASDETVTLTDAGGGQTMVDSTVGEMVTFNSPTTLLSLDAGAGTNIVDVTGIDAGATHAFTITDLGNVGTDTVNLTAGMPAGLGDVTINTNIETITIPDAGLTIDSNVDLLATSDITTTSAGRTLTFDVGGLTLDSAGADTAFVLTAVDGGSNNADITLNGGEADVSGSVTGTLDVASAGITQTAALSTGGVTTLNSGGGASDITLTQANTLGDLVVTGNVVQITENDAITGGGAWTTGATTLDSTSNAITLTDGGNVMGDLSLTGTGVQITENDDITDGIAWNVSTATLDAQANAITLDAANEFSGTVDLQNTGANDVLVTDANTLIVGDVDVGAGGGGSLSVDAAGGIAGSTEVNVDGSTTLTTAGNVDLNNTANTFTGSVAFTTPANVTIVDDTALDLGALSTGTLSVTAAGITQSGDLTSTGATTFSAVGNSIALNTNTNNFGALTVTGDVVSITEAVDITQGGAWTTTGATALNAPTITLTDTGNVLGDLTVTAQNASITENADITDGAAWDVDVSTTLDAQANAITLDAANDFTGPVNLANTGANDISVNDVNELVLGTVDAGQDLILNAGGNVSGTDEVNVAGTTTFNTATDVSLTNVANTLGPIAFTVNPANLTLVDDSALDLPTGLVTGGLSITAAGITQSGAVTSTGVTTFSAMGNSIVLTDAANDFGALVVTGDVVSITENADITQNAAWTTTGLTTLNATGNLITLNDPANVLGDLIVLGSGTTSIVENDAITGGGAWAAGATTLNSTGNAITLTDTGNVIGDLSLTGGVTQITENDAITDGTAWSVTDATLNAQANAITLDAANDFTGTVNLQNTGANDVLVTDANTITLGDVDVGIGGGGNLIVDAAGGISGTTEVNVEGNTTLTTAGDVSLTNALNTFTGTVAFTTPTNVTIVDDTALDLGALSTGNLSVTAAGITQSGDLTTTGATILSAAGNTIDLSTNTNVLGDLTVTGDTVLITEADAITQGGDWTVGATTLDAGANAITLTNAGNDFSGLLNLNNTGAFDVEVTDANNVQLGTVSIGQNLLVTANAGAGSIDITQDVTSGGTQTYDGTVLLSQAGLTTLTGSTVTFNSTAAGADNTRQLSIVGNFDFGGAISTLDALTVDGNTLIGQNVTTENDQTYGVGGDDTITLTADANLTSNAGTVTFNGTADGDGDADNLTITGNFAIDNAVGGTTPFATLTVTGTTGIGADVSTTGNQDYQGAATLTAGPLRTLTSDTGDVIFGTSLDGGAFSLDIAGNMELGGDAINLNVLDVTGTSDIGGDVTSTGTQDYDNDVLLTTNSTLTTTNANITVGAGGIAGTGLDLTLNPGSGDIAVTGDVGAMGSALGTLSVTDATNATFNDGVYVTTLDLNSTQAGTFDFNGFVSANALTTSLSAAATNLRFDAGGTIATGPVLFDIGGDLTLDGGSVTALTFDGGVDTVTLGVGGTVFTNGTIQTSADDILFGDITLFGDTIIDSTGGALTLATATSDGTFTLTLDGDAGGDINMTSLVNGGDFTITDSNSTTVTGTVAANDVLLTDTTGLIQFQDVVTANSILAPASNLGQVQFVAAPDVATTGTFNNVSAADPDLIFNAGGAFDGGLTTTAGTTTQLTGVLSTTDTPMTLGDTLTLAGDSTLISDTGVIDTQAITDGGSNFTLSLQEANTGVTYGNVTVNGAITIDTLQTFDALYDVNLLAGGTIDGAGPTEFLNTGTTRIGDEMADNLLFVNGVETANNTSNPTSTVLGGQTRTTDALIDLGPTTVDAGDTAAYLDSGTGLINIVSVADAGDNALHLQNLGGTGNVTVDNDATIDSLITYGQAYDVNLLGGGFITQNTTFNNTGALTLGDDLLDDLTFDGGVTAIVQSGISAAGFVRTTGDAMTLGDPSAAGTGPFLPGVMPPILMNDNLTLSVGTGGALATIGGVTDDVNAFVLTVGEAGEIGQFDFTEAVTVDTLATVASDYNIRFLEGGTIVTDTTFLNNANSVIQIGDADTDVMNFNGGVDTTAALRTDTAGSILSINTQQDYGDTQLIADTQTNAGDGQIIFESVSEDAPWTLSLQDGVLQGGDVTVINEAVVTTLETFTSDYGVAILGLDGTQSTITTDTDFLNTDFVQFGDSQPPSSVPAGRTLPILAQPSIFEFTGGLDTTASGTTFVAGTVQTVDADMDLGGSIMLDDTTLLTGAGLMNVFSINDLLEDFTLTLQDGAASGTVTIGEFDLNRIVATNGAYDVFLLENGDVDADTNFLNTGDVYIGDETGDEFNFNGGLDTTQGPGTTFIAGKIQTFDTNMDLGPTVLRTDAQLVTNAGIMNVESVNELSPLTLTVQDGDSSGTVTLGTAGSSVSSIDALVTTFSGVGYDVILTGDWNIANASNGLGTQFQNNGAVSLGTVATDNLVFSSAVNTQPNAADVTNLAGNITVNPGVDPTPNILLGNAVVTDTTILTNTGPTGSVIEIGSIGSSTGFETLELVGTGSATEIEGVTSLGTLTVTDAETLQVNDDVTVTNLIDLNATTGGLFNFDGLVDVAQFDTGDGTSLNLALNGGALIDNLTTIDNAGTLVLGNGVGGDDLLTFTGGLDATAASVTDISLGGTIAAVGGSDINMGNVVNGPIGLNANTTISIDSGTAVLESVAEDFAGTTLTLGDTGSTGVLQINNDLTVTSLATASAPYTVRLLGLTAVTSDTTFNNTTNVWLGDGFDENLLPAVDTLVFAGGLDTTNVTLTNTNGEIATTNQQIDLGGTTMLGDTTLLSGSGTTNVASITDDAAPLNLSLQDVSSTGEVTFIGDASVNTLTTFGGGYAVNFDGGATIDTNTVFNNLGTVAFGNDTDLTTFTAGVDTATRGLGTTTEIGGTLASANAPIALSDTDLVTMSTVTSNGGSIDINNIDSAANMLTLNGAGTGNVTVASFGGLGNLTLANADNALFTGTVDAGAVQLTTASTGVTFADVTNATSLNSDGNAFDVALNGATTTVTGTTTLGNTGTSFLGDDGDDLEFTGGLTATAGTTDVFGAVSSGAGDITTSTTLLSGVSSFDANGLLTTTTLDGQGNSATLNAGSNMTYTTVTGVDALTLTGTTQGNFQDTDAGTVAMTGGTDYSFNNTLNVVGDVSSTGGVSTVFINSGTSDTGTFANTGAVTLGNGGADVNTFTSGVSVINGTIAEGEVRSATGDMLLSDLTLSGNLTVDATNVGGSTGTNVVVQTVTGQNNDLTINAGANGDVTFLDDPGVAFDISGVDTLSLAFGSTFDMQGGVQATTTEFLEASIFTVEGALDTDTLTTNANAAVIELFGTGTDVANQLTFNNTGGIFLGDETSDVLRFAGGLDTQSSLVTTDATIRTAAAAIVTDALAVAGDTYLDTTDGNAPGTATTGTVTLGATNGVGGTEFLELRTGLSDISVEQGVTNLGSFFVRSGGEMTLGEVSTNGNSIRTVTTGNALLNGDLTAANGDISIVSTEGQIIQAANTRINAQNGAVDLVAFDGMQLFEVESFEDILLALLGPDGGLIQRVGDVNNVTPDFIMPNGTLVVVGAAPTDFGEQINGFRVDGGNQFFNLAGGSPFIDVTTATTLTQLSPGTDAAVQDVFDQSSDFGDRFNIETTINNVVAGAISGVSGTALGETIFDRSIEGAQNQQSEQGELLTNLGEEVFIDIALYDYDRERPLCLPGSVQGPDAAPCASGERTAQFIDHLGWELAGAVSRQQGGQKQAARNPATGAFMGAGGGGR